VTAHNGAIVHRCVFLRTATATPTTLTCTSKQDYYSKKCGNWH